MKPEDHTFFARRLLELVQEMEQIIKNYSRLLTADDDGHWLEQNENDEEPF